MSERRRDSLTEPIFQYSEGTVLDDHSFGDINVYSVSHAGSVENIYIPDHYIFLVESDVMSVDTWEGMQFPERHWATGDVAFVPAGSTCSSKTSSTFSETLITLPDDWFRKVARKGIDYSTIDFRFKDLPDTTTFSVASAVRDIAAAKRAHCPPLVIESMSLSLSTAVASALSPQVSQFVTRMKNGLSRERKKRVVDYVEANLDRHIRLEELARVAAMSPYHFSRSFKKSLGISPVRYVWSRRVEAAKRLMRGSLSLAMIAYACGFLSQSHFTTVFKQTTGHTPGAYRRNVQT